MKFKRGEIIESPDGQIWVVEKDGSDGEYLIQSIGPMRKEIYHHDECKPYTGPEYKKAEKRFVPSKEWRFPERGEWFVGKDPRGGREVVPLQNGHDGISVGTGGVSMGYKPILLLVPEVEPEFKVGDYIKHKISGKVLPYKDDYYQFVAEDWEKHIDPFLEGTREITDEDLVSCSAGYEVIVVRCKAPCCSPRDGGIVFYDQINDEGEIIPWREGSLSLHIRPEGHILHYHEGNDSPFAKMCSSKESWKVEWLIPKEDIRVVEEAI